MKIEEIRNILNKESDSLYRRFITACTLVDTVTPVAKKEMTTETQSKFYQFYKQGAFGDQCRGPQPSRIYYAEYIKWTTWNEVAGMAAEEAQQNYIEVALEILDEVEKHNEKAVKVLTQLTQEDLVKNLLDKCAKIKKELVKHNIESKSLSELISLLEKENTAEKMESPTVGVIISKSSSGSSSAEIRSDGADSVKPILLSKEAAGLRSLTGQSELREKKSSSTAKSSDKGEKGSEFLPEYVNATEGSTTVESIGVLSSKPAVNRDQIAKM